MRIQFKKTVLIMLVIPASIHWLGMCVIGLAIFSHGAFRDIPSFFLFFITLAGLFFLLVAVVSVIRYPKMSKFTIYVIGLGCSVLTIVLYMGAYSELWLLFSASSLFLGSAFLMLEYIWDT